MDLETHKVGGFAYWLFCIQNSVGTLALASSPKITSLGIQPELNKI